MVEKTQDHVVESAMRRMWGSAVNQDWDWACHTFLGTEIAECRMWAVDWEWAFHTVLGA
jgi:hypothetical protein